MRVLMLSLDKTLLGKQIQGKFGVQGDTVKRHVKYGELVDKLDILVTSPPGFVQNKISDKVNIYPTNSNTKTGHLKSAVDLAGKIIKHSDLDLIVAQDLTAPAALKIKQKHRVPFIVSFHGADFTSPEWQQGLKGKFVLYLTKRAVKHADGLRVVSEAMKQYFVDLGVLCPIAVIPTPSDFSIFAAGEIKNVNENIVLTDGRLEPVKNYPLLFKVIQLLVTRYSLQVACKIIGTGSQEEKLKKLVRQMKLENNVEFLGSLPYDQLPTIYQTADVFVLASDSESLGKVLIQAGVTGLPVVATKTLGAQGIVKDSETGFLVDIGDATGLADKINILLTDKDLREKLGRAACEHVTTNYDSEENIKKLIEFWKSINKKFV
jgi:glycosyltransferase involved in cell wall biosynthesis